MSIRVHHYYPLGSENVGDHLVARAIRAALVRHLGPCAFTDMPVNDRYRADDRPIGLRGENIDRSNAEADLVVVGGSNLLEARKRGRWGVFTDADSIRRLKPPLLLMGMGNGSDFATRIRRYAEPGLTEVRMLHERAFAHSVRDQKTVEELSRIGIETRCVGCPVTYLTDRPVTAASKDLPLLVSLTPPRVTRHFTGPAFMRSTIDYIAWLKQRGVNQIVTLHDSRDIEVARKIVPPGIEIFHTDNLDELIARFEQSRGVIGFRLHAALLGLSLGKPIIPVGVDWRGLAFQQAFGLDNIAIRSLRFGQFAKLRQLTDRLLENDPAILQQLTAAKEKFRLRFEEFLTNAAVKFKAIR